MASNKGSRARRALTADQVRAARLEYYTGKGTIKQIATAYGLALATMRNVLRGITYAEIPLPPEAAGKGPTRAKGHKPHVHAVRHAEAATRQAQLDEAHAARAAEVKREASREARLRKQQRAERQAVWRAEQARKAAQRIPTPTPPKPSPKPPTPTPTPKPSKPSKPSEAPQGLPEAPRDPHPVIDVSGALPTRQDARKRLRALHRLPRIKR